MTVLTSFNWLGPPAARYHEHLRVFLSNMMPSLAITAFLCLYWLLPVGLSEAACRAIVACGQLNEALGHADACETVIAALKQHQMDEAIAQWGCRAVGSLATHKRNRSVVDSVDFTC